MRSCLRYWHWSEDLSFFLLVPNSNTTLQPVFKQYFSLSIQSIIRPILPRKSIIYIFFISSIFTSCVKSTTSYLFGPIRKLFPWKKGCFITSFSVTQSFHRPKVTFHAKPYAMFCLKFPYLANISAYILVFKIFSNRLMIYDYSSHERFNIWNKFLF